MWDQKQGNQMRISIIEHPTLNVERKSSLRCSMLGCSMLDAGCWMFVLILLIAGTANAAYDPTAHKTDFTTFETIWHDATRNRDVPAKIYYPTTAPSKLPVIIFSHGLGGSRTGYSYLGKFWASHGYVSVHLTHVGSDTDALMAGGVDNIKKNMQIIATTPMNAVDRCKDVSFAIDELTSANESDDKFPLKGKLDLKHIGMAGHSFGGNTTMLISGEMTRSGHSFADDRITCAIAMSPPVATPQDAWDKVYANVKIPLFVMTGTLDDSPVGETKAADRRVPYDHVKDIPAYLITYDGGDHMIFSGRRIAGGDRPKDERFHELICMGSEAFWDAYLRDDAAAKSWLKNEYGNAVGADGVFEQK
jgi:dienelactone hydrolase